MKLTDKSVTVLGLSKRTGVATIKFLLQQGANVIASDTKSQTELAAELEFLGSEDVTLDLGGHTPELILESDLIVISPGVPVDIPILERARAKGIEVISEVELAYRFGKAQLLAITGTNGKTTTTSLAGEVFNRSEFNSIVGGNIGRTLIRDLPYLNCGDVAIAEISSFQLEGVKQFQPDISLVLNLTPDHIKRHGSFANYVAAKRKLVARQKADDYAVLNYDDPQVREFASATEAEVIFFSQQVSLDRGIFVAEDKIVSNLSGNKEEIIAVDELALQGPHNLENALGVVAMSLLMEVDQEVLATGLRQFSGVEHRIEQVAKVDGVKYINDSKGTNPVAAIKALETFSAPIVLIAGGMDKGSDFTEFAQAAVDKVKAVVLLGETAKQIEAELTKLGFNSIYQVDSIQEAVRQSDELVTTGDIVLLSPACASWDMFSSYKERGNLFKEAVQRLRRG